VSTAAHGSYANTSGPVAVFERLGGFDERFVGWGGEDFEMTVRVPAAGVPMRSDAQAIAWHDQRRGIMEMCAKTVDRGRNAVRICEIHPDVTDHLFAAWSPQAPAPHRRATPHRHAVDGATRGRGGRPRAGDAVRRPSEVPVTRGRGQPAGRRHRL